MSLEHIRSECSDVAALLQPHVDGELAEPEQLGVANHLEDCSACRAAVAEQMWVRATLQAVEPERAPRALSARVLLDLDAVDREDAAAALAAAPPPSLWSRVRGRMAELMRGGAVMVPAAAVAGGLFLVARGGFEPVQTLPASGLSTAMTRATVNEPENTDADRPDTQLPGLASIQPQLAFPIQVAQPGAERVQLVGARLDPTVGSVREPGAQLRYRVFQADDGGVASHIPGHLIDRQRPVGGPSPEGVPVTFKGQRYMVGRADSGEPVVHFERGGVAHLISLEGATAKPRVGDSADSPDFSLLLDLADQLAQSR